MKNSDLFKYPTQTLTTLEQQDRFVVGKALVPMPCPMCHNPVSKIDATGKGIDDYDVRAGGEPDFACPHCKTELRFCLPLMGAASWVRKTPIPTGDAK